MFGEIKPDSQTYTEGTYAAFAVSLIRSYGSAVFEYIRNSTIIFCAVSVKRRNGSKGEKQWHVEFHHSIRKYSV